MYILLVEDDEVDQLAFERSMKACGFNYKIASSIEKAKELIAVEKFDIIISDFQLPDGTGIDLLEMRFPIPIVITTGTGREEIAVRAMKTGAFDYLIKDLNRSYLTHLPQLMEQAIIRQKTNRLVAIFGQTLKSITDGVCITDPENKIIFVNKAFNDLFGYKDQELIGQSAGLLQEKINYKTPQNTSNEKIPTEFVLTRLDGTTFPCLVTHSTVEDENQIEIARATIYKNISEHTDAERLLRKKAEELAHTRAELEQLELFSFVSTHDLQEPLHKITTFGNLIMADPEIVLTETAIRYRNKILEATQELSQMISQLHDYSKILTAGEPFTSVNLNVVIHDVLEKLKPQIDTLKAHFHIDNLPSVQGDQRQLYKLFLNLLKNALIYHQENVEPEVFIRCSHSEGVIVLSIEDNGIGFDEKFLSRLFKPFQRLHTSKEFPGRGLGLAISKRIIQRHLGEISAASTPGKGSVFTLTFPENSETIGK